MIKLFDGFYEVDTRGTMFDIQQSCNSTIDVVWMEVGIFHNVAVGRSAIFVSTDSSRVEDLGLVFNLDAEEDVPEARLNQLPDELLSKLTNNVIFKMTKDFLEGGDCD